MAYLKGSICIPFVGTKEILGFWTLLDETGSETYSTEEIARLMALGEQAAINIENSKMFEKIRERDRLAVLGEMAAGMAHEIRNPLGAIKGAAQYLDPTSVGEEAAEFLKIIVEETDRLNLVVNQFLDYARPFQSLMEPTDVNQVVSQTTKLIPPELEDRKIDLKLELQRKVPLVKASAQQLTQVLLNLLNNALDSMPQGGTLTVRTRTRSAEIGPPSRPGRWVHAVEIRVIDTGCGISPDVLERVFVPFFTTKEKGTGLGLAISQRIIEHHGGEIRVRSTQGVGSTFTIVLPVAPDPEGILTDSDFPVDSDPNLQQKMAISQVPFPDQPNRGNAS
jgi:signal transduction histidine kinase